MDFEQSTLAAKIVELARERFSQVVRHHKTSMVKEDQASVITIKVTIMPNSDASVFAHKISTSISLAAHPEISGVIFAGMDDDGTISIGEHHSQQRSLPID